MRIRYVWIAILVALVVPVLPAPAANQAVSTTSSDTFTPANVTVLQGESVTWSNPSGSGFHNVHFDDDSFDEPADPVDTNWTVPRTFNQPGTFRYYCEAHGSQNGVGMSGTVTVQATGGGPGPGPGPGADKTAPALKLGGTGTQRVLRQRAVKVGVEVDESSTVVARATISVPGASKLLRTSKTTRQLAPRTQAKLRLKLSKRTLRSLRRALAQRSRLTARVTVTATDSAGNKRSAKRKIKLKA